jgi:hypothetical protein
MRTKFLIPVLVGLLAACGGGGGGASPQKLKIAFYGDSITTQQVPSIAKETFDWADYSIGGQHSDAPLHPSDDAPVVVLRYGMADAAHGLTPQETRRNLLDLRSKVQARGSRPIVVNVSQTPTGFERPTNEAIADMTDIDVSWIEGETLDGIHPDDTFYGRLNDHIHRELARLTGEKPSIK